MMRLPDTVSVGVAVVLALAAAHCMAGFAVYGSMGGRAQLLQVGSLKLSTASPELVQQAVAQSWSQVCAFILVYVCICVSICESCIYVCMGVHMYTHTRT